MRRLLVAALLLLTAAPAAAQHVSPTTTLPSGATLNNPNITGTVTGGATYTSPTLTTPTINGAASSSTVTLGSGSGTGTLCAVASVTTAAVGNVGGGEDDLMTYALPANSLSTDGSFVRVTVGGTTAANGNTKVVRVYFGGASPSSAMLNAGLNNGSWGGTMFMARTGATTQEGGVFSQDTAGNNAVFRRLTGTETLSGAITIKVTGASGSSATDDIVQRLMIVEVCNR